MAHFAEIDENNIVLRVAVVPNEQEHRAQEFISVDLKLGGRWIQCSYNNKIRKQYPGEGYTYDEANDVFIVPKPFDSWTLNENFDWEPPVPFPEPTDDGSWAWNEDELRWIYTSLV
jgi:hypothetical protein